MKIKTTMKGWPEWNAKVKVIHKRMRDTRPFFQSLGIQVVKWIQLNYKQSGGLLEGKKWPKLARSTQMSRRKKSHRPLMDTGALMKAWNWVAKRTSVVIGNPMDIAAFHEEGTSSYIIRPVKAKVLWFGTATSGVTPAIRRKGWKKGSKPPGAFARMVRHPGLRARRQLPTENEIMPTAIKVADVWLKKVIR